jgi:membrane protein YqaA with SNARE-associated domain
MGKLTKLGAFLQTYGPWGIFGIAMIDSLGAPLPGLTDVVLMEVAVHSVHAPGTAYFTALMAMAGSLVGNAILFQAVRHGRRLFSKKEADPGKFQAWFRRYGLLTVFVPAVVPFVPLPLKVFVISAAAFRTSFGTFMAVIAAARAIRYFGMAYLGLQLGADAQGFLTRNGWTIVGVAIVIAYLLYIAMRWSERRRAA